MTTLKNYLLLIAFICFASTLSSCDGEEDFDVDLGPTAQALEEKIGSGFEGEKLRDVSVDGNGTIYVSTKTKIYKVDATGNATVFAGNNNAAVTDGVGTDASFRNIDLITFDENSNLFVKDYRVIRKITPGGLVSSIEINHPTPLLFKNYEDDTNVPIEFSPVFPVGDALYTGDWYMIKIKGDAHNVFSGNFDQELTDGPANEAAYLDLMGGFYDEATNSIIVGDRSAVRQVSIADSSVTTITGKDEFGEADGNLADARFQFVRDIVQDNDGNLYLADRYTIRKISVDGIVSTIAGPFYQDGSQLQTGGLAIDKESKFLYITDTNAAETLIKIDLSTI